MTLRHGSLAVVQEGHRRHFDIWCLIANSCTELSNNLTIYMMSYEIYSYRCRHDEEQFWLNQLCNSFAVR